MRKRAKRQAYFTRLLISFFLVGILPLAAASISFYASSLRAILRANSQRGRDAAAIAASTLADQLDTYRHIAYSVSKLPIVLDAFSLEEKARDSAWLKELYQSLYAEIGGHLYETSVHILGSGGQISYSTHQLPHRYDLSYYENMEGIFSESRPNPDRTYLYLDPFLSERGERVACSFLRDIPGGYVVVDVLASALVSAAAQPVFDSMILIDQDRLKAFDFFRPERDGTFDHFPELTFMGEAERNMIAEGKTIMEGSLLVAPRAVADTSLVLLGTVHSDQYRLALKPLWEIGLWILLVLIVTVVLTAWRISRQIGTPVHAVVAAMELITEGVPPKLPETKRYDELGLLVTSYNRMVERLDELVERTREEERALQAAERKALQAQINPHFLYNTLGTIKSIAKLRGVPEIVDIATGLGRLFRAAVGGDGAFVPLRESVDILKSYIAIQHYRFGERLYARFLIPEELANFSVPRLILQPIVENAVVHALDSSLKPLELTICARKAADHVIITIRDDGPGIEPGRLRQVIEESDRVGIANVRRRMELLYQNRGGFSIESPPEGGTLVTFLFPLEE
jgi:two-component system sensor histidine kinase YesM